MDIYIDKQSVFVFLIPWMIIRIASFRLNKANRRKFLLKREIILNIFFIYILCLISVTLFPLIINFESNYNWISVNLIPIIGTVNEITKTTKDAAMHDFMIKFWIKNILGNAVLLLPLGVLIPVLRNKYNSMIKIILVALCLSLSIETIQLASGFIGNFGRAFDIDDILLNTFGASVGFVFYKIFIENKKSSMTKALKNNGIETIVKL